ncbi:MAG: hypothetical protein ACM37W_03655 [Actinomycetota bacterium]
MEIVEQSKRIDVRAAVSAVKDYCQAIQDLIRLSSNDIRLEEVELSDDRKFWLITISFEGKTFAEEHPMGSRYINEREYKIFKVNAQTGEVESMKIREV